MGIFHKRRKTDDELSALSAVNADRCEEKFSYRIAHDAGYLESELYDRLRENVPVIDACIEKIVRLVGDFRAVADDERWQDELDRFCQNVPVGISGRSIHTFADMYLDCLLTYGKAVGRVFTDRQRLCVRGLYVGDPTLYHITVGKTPLDMKVYGSHSGKLIPTSAPHKLLYTTLNPSPKNPEGVSLLRGLPAISNILMRIYECIGQNFERAGNVRYAVTYKPSSDAGDKLYAKERAMAIAKEWSDGMNASRNGVVKDFISVGDVDIRVIGADNQIIDTQVPVRQLLEQIVAKLSIPPFLLGLNWSTTEKMSSQQADILTSELEYYRRLLTPVLKRVCDTFLRLCGAPCGCSISWANINLQDELALARARLYNAQAAQIEGKEEG
ncbi:MAG: phage portal protein [Ruminococcus sp.]|nr:phage portal protein [Ruminococcus sp.]